MMNMIDHTPTRDFADLDRARWRIVESRDTRFDGAFVYAVSSTGIFCRPSCPSRRPKPTNVSYYDSPESAGAAGYRPCRRCHPESVDQPDPRLAAVYQACRYMDERDDEDGPPTLDTLAELTQFSPHHLQRLFKRLLGISPRDYYDARRIDRLKALLRDGDNVALALYEAGYGSSSRLYEHAASRLGMTPGVYKRGGRGTTLSYAIADSPLGRVLVARTGRGVAAVNLGRGDDMLLAELGRDYPNAEIVRDDGALAADIRAILDYLEGAAPHPDLPLDVQATAFQRRVWRELQNIPPGETRTYAEVAEAIGNPKAVRAVANACARNPTSLVVPCHRVVRSDGGLGGYRWGVERKQALLDQERAKAEAK